MPGRPSARLTSVLKLNAGEMAFVEHDREKKKKKKKKKNIKKTRAGGRARDWKQ